MIYNLKELSEDIGRCQGYNNRGEKVNARIMLAIAERLEEIAFLLEKQAYKDYPGAR